VNFPRICFILDHDLKPYRQAFFEQMSQRCEKLVIIHSGRNLDSLSQVIQISLPKRRLLAFEYRVLPDLKQFDVVVHMQNLRFINLWQLTLNPWRKFKLVHWGIGASSAGGLHISKNLVSRTRDFIARYADAQVLYSSFALPLFSNTVIQKTFIAHNTVESRLSQDLSVFKKNSILFIGTLNPRKGIEVLLDGFSDYLKSAPVNLKKLVIIGDGPMRTVLEKKVQILRMESFVEFKGSIISEHDKLDFYKSAAVSVSPYQAGLSVLECFSYGVPFITFENCISGGEHLNIDSGETGYLIRSREELVIRLLEMDRNPDLGKRLGKNAYDHYVSKRRMEHMVASFLETFNFVLRR